MVTYVLHENWNENEFLSIQFLPQNTIFTHDYHKNIMIKAWRWKITHRSHCNYNRVNLSKSQNYPWCNLPLKIFYNVSLTLFNVETSISKVNHWLYGAYKLCINQLTIFIHIVFDVLGYCLGHNIILIPLP